jgi:hypothetical protein
MPIRKNYIMSLVPQLLERQTNASTCECWSEYGRQCHVPNFSAELLEIKLVKFAILL